LVSELRRASSDHTPPPTEIRKSKEQNIAKSVRASLTMYQTPWLGRNSSGIFVVTIAVVMMMNSGAAAALVPRPSKTSRPQTIFKRADEMRSEIGMRKSDPGETIDTHLGVDIFENALREEDQPHRDSDKEDGGWSLWRCEKESEQ
jgi:hypothetical protein